MVDIIHTFVCKVCVVQICFKQNGEQKCERLEG